MKLASFTALLSACLSTGFYAEVYAQQPVFDENGTAELTFTNEVAERKVPSRVNEQEKPSSSPRISTSKAIKLAVENEAIFDEDLLLNMPESTPTNALIPRGLSSVLKLEYLGAFRVNAPKNDVSSSNYAVGTLGYNPKNNSLFIAGHSHHNAIAEFAIPTKLSLSTNPANIVNAKLLQPYTRILDNVKPDKITGMLAFNDSLIVTSEIWYDGGGTNKDNIFSLELSNISQQKTDLAQLNGAATVAGYMSKIPQSARQLLGGDHLVGWASNYSITSRYSQGPSLAVFNPQDILDNKRLISTDIKQVYPMKKGKRLHPQGNNNNANANQLSPLWTNMSSARYSFIVPDSTIFIAVGSSGGLHGGLGYKIIQDNGNRCPGGCSRIAADYYNYFWLYDVNAIVNAVDPWDPRPFSYGKFIMPYKGKVIGAAFDGKDTLYISIAGAARVGEYDRPPLILAYKISAKEPKK